MFNYITLIENFGLSMGLFLSTFVGSTVFLPFSVEASFVFFLKYMDPYHIILIAGCGALCGTCINYGLGYLGSGIIEKKIKSEKVERAREMLNTRGFYGLFVIIFLPIPLPIPVDPITIVPGLMRMNFFKFIIVVFVAKLARYAVFVGVLKGIFGFISGIF